MTEKATCEADGVRRWEVTLERKVIVYAETSDAAQRQALVFQGNAQATACVELSPVSAERNCPSVDLAPVVSTK